MPLHTLHAITEPHHRVVAALDQETWNEAVEAFRCIGDYVGLAKVNSVADRIGLDRAVRTIYGMGALTMVDYKYHDIDDTMRRRTREATLARGRIITIHASNTTKAMKMAVTGMEQALAEEPTLYRPWLLGVTVLTSISDKERDSSGQPLETCTSIYGADRMTKVRQFAHKAADAGLDGIVCSPQEAEMVKSDPYTEHLKVALAAIRPLFAAKTRDEQVTATTPRIAIETGADLLIIGRPLVNAAAYGLTGPEAAQTIAQEIAEVTGIPLSINN